MLNIQKKYIVNELNVKIAVQIDIKVYEQIESALENFGLMQFVSENEGEKPLEMNEAKEYYKKLKKAK